MNIDYGDICVDCKHLFYEHTPVELGKRKEGKVAIGYVCRLCVKCKGFKLDSSPEEGQEGQVTVTLPLCGCGVTMSFTQEQHKKFIEEMMEWAISYSNDNDKVPNDD